MLCTEAIEYAVQINYLFGQIAVVSEHVKADFFSSLSALQLRFLAFLALPFVLLSFVFFCLLQNLVGLNRFVTRVMITPGTYVFSVANMRHLLLQLTEEIARALGPTRVRGFGAGG